MDVLREAKGGVIVTNGPGLAEGMSFFVRLVAKGERYGLNQRLVHDDADPLVEFYDVRYVEEFRSQNGGEGWGQYVARYYRETLLQGPPVGLDLDGGIPNWAVDVAAMTALRGWLVQGLPDCSTCANKFDTHTFEVSAFDLDRPHSRAGQVVATRGSDGAVMVVRVYPDGDGGLSVHIIQESGVTEYTHIVEGE